MRQHLATVIELISIVTAIGIVVSALLYSIAFSQFGLSYIAIASLADILRDSVRLLILVVGMGLAAFPAFAIIIPNIAQGSPRTRLLLSIAFGAVVSLIILVSTLIVFVVSGLSFDNEFTNFSALGIGAVGAFTSVMVFFTGRFMAPVFGKEKFSLSSQLRRAGWPRLFLMTAVWLTGSFIMVYSVMVQQLRDGLPMRVNFSTLTMCPGEHRIVAWMGDTKAVIKCEKSGRYEVKILG